MNVTGVVMDLFPAGSRGDRNATGGGAGIPYNLLAIELAIAANDGWSGL